MTDEHLQQLRETLKQELSKHRSEVWGSGWNMEDEKYVNNIMQAITATIEAEVARAELKSDIKYNTLKARYQRMFLGGEEDALPTKRYVKRLKVKLAALQATQQQEKEEKK